MYPVEDLATHLDTELPDGVNVYGWAADIGKLPAVALIPGDPAVTIITQAPGNEVLAWGVELTIVVSRSQPKYALRAIYDLFQQVRLAAESSPDQVRIVALESIGDLDWAGEDALAGSVPIIITRQENI